MKRSAGILLFRRTHGETEVLLVHPGGPFWAGKDVGAWSIPKGEFVAGEDALSAAIREFKEETGCSVSGDFIFCSTGYRTGSALLKLTKDGDGVKAKEEYFLDGNKLQNHHGGMVLKDGYIYCGHQHNQGFPICVEMATGKTVWGGEGRGPGSGSAAVTYADGNLIFRYQSGEVALIEASPSGYKLKGSFKPEYISSKDPCWAHPVVIGGRLYLRDQDKLMCYDVRG